MAKKLITNLAFGVCCAVVVVLAALIILISWLAICGLTYLVTLIFGWTYSWLAASGFWVAIVLIGAAAMPEKRKK